MEKLGSVAEQELTGEVVGRGRPRKRWRDKL